MARKVAQIYSALDSVTFPNIAAGWQDSWCYETFCNGEATRITLQSRDAAARAAYQAYLIGVDYTYTTGFKTPVPAISWDTARRGIYRCDTFVLDMLWFSKNYPLMATLSADQARWDRQHNDLAYPVDVVMTPKYIFNSLKLAQ